MTSAQRLYAGLLRAYPNRVRRAYGDSMVQLFGDQLRDARASGSPVAVGVTWLRAILDLASSALAERSRTEDTVAQSVEIYQPTPLMRMLGMLGIVGGVLLLGAFVAGTLFSDAVANNVRLFMFAAGGIAVALALYRRQAVVAPRLALLATAAVVGSGIWTLAQLVVAAGLEHPFAGTFGFVYFLAGLAAWLAAAAFGAAVLVIGAAARGLNPWLALAVRAGAMALAIGSPLAILGMDRLALTHQQPYGALIGNLALAGIALNGAGWVLLGLGVLLGGRRRQPV